MAIIRTWLFFRITFNIIQPGKESSVVYSKLMCDMLWAQLRFYFHACQVVFGEIVARN